MDLSAARDRALSLMTQHGLTSRQPSLFSTLLPSRRAWSFAFDHSRRRFGMCSPRARRIQLSRHLTALNSSVQVEDTILHEISHALAFLKYRRNVGHGPRWKAIAREVGADPRRCYDAAAVKLPAAPYLAKCPAGHEFPRLKRFRRRRKVSCAKCSPRFDERHLLRLVPNNPGRSADK
ncbi:MAG: SprT family zinc-dependent metalloprotease [Elusimicrobiota bacterium]